MPAKRDYLRDLRENPHSMSAEVLSRVKAPTLGAVETAFRKYAADGLVESDDSKPKGYALTDKGAEELRKLESQAPGCRISIEPVSEPASNEERPASGRARALLDKAKALLSGNNDESEPDRSELRVPKPDAPPVAWDNPNVRQLYGLQLGMSDLPRRDVRDRKDSLAGIVGPEIADLIAQLVSSEEQLAAESDSFWGDQDEAERLQEEIAELRGKLGCSAQGAEVSGE